MESYEDWKNRVREKRTIGPGPLRMIEIVKERFTKKDLNLTDEGLVLKYSGTLKISKMQFELTNKALRLYISRHCN